MMLVDDVKSLLAPAFPDALQIHVADMTGSMDHFQIEIVSLVFQGKTLIQQHQMVQKPLQGALADGRIHAVAIKTFTPEQWKKTQEGGFNVIG